MPRNILRLRAICLGVLSLMLIAWWATLPSGQAPEKKISSVPKLPAGTNWKKLTERDMRKLASNFDSKKDHVLNDFETLVAEGEEVVTQGCETEPGVFVFSSFKPQTYRKDDGTYGVEIEMKTMEMSVLGSFKEVVKRTKKVPDGYLCYMVFSGGHAIDMNIYARPDDLAPGMIKMKTQEMPMSVGH